MVIVMVVVETVVSVVVMIMRMVKVRSGYLKATHSSFSCDLL